MVNNEYMLLRAIAQKERLEIIKHLMKEDKNISELATITHLDRATVSYHLGVLEHNKLVSSEYRMIKPPQSMGKIGRYYKIDEAKLDQALAMVKNLLEIREKTNSLS